jgi:hypothetical protein
MCETREPNAKLGLLVFHFCALHNGSSLYG